MSDIDFDELDQAVNTALGSNVDDTPDKPVQQAPARPATDTALETKVTAEPSPVKPTITATPQRTPLASPAAKRSGRFMDMVHPSSVMDSEASTRPAPKLKIVPSVSFEKESQQTDDLSEEEAKALLAAAPPVAETPVDVTPNQPPAMPDPLDVLSVESEEKQPQSTEPERSREVEPEVKAVESVADEKSSQELSTETSTAQSDPEPTAADPSSSLTVPVATEATPFLSDAKVEKRPLGGFGTPEPIDTSADTQLEPDTVLPESLQSDIVAVEQSQITTESFSTVADESAHLEVTQNTEATTASPQPPQSPSIPQQYRSEPASTDETQHSVFDTDQYHQPMIAAHVAHKGSRTWVFVLIIAALLVVGAALGYFAFMSGL